MSSKSDSSDKDTQSSLLFENELLSNFTLCVGSEQFRIHKEILASKSKVFLKMFTTGMDERSKSKQLFIITGVDATIFREMLRYIYTNSVDEISTHAHELYKVAVRFDLPNLKNLCSTDIAANLKLTNALQVLEFSGQNNDKELKDKAINFIAQNIKSFVNTKNFKDWYSKAPSSETYSLLSSVATNVRRKGSFSKT